MAKQLMEEEKMARRIKRDLPRLTKLLTEKLDEWKEANEEDFLFNGEVYVEVMERQEEEWNEYKKHEIQAKLRKKQDDQIMVENKFLGKTNHNGKKRQPVRPLGDGSRLGNTAHNGGGRSTHDLKGLRPAHGANARHRNFA